MPPVLTSRDTSIAVLFGAVIALILLVLGQALSAEFDRADELDHRLATSFETRQLVEELLDSHVELETGQRGYVLSGNRSYLPPYLAGVRAIDPLLTKLDAAARNSPTLAGALPAIKAESARRRAAAAEVIRIRDEQGLLAASAAIGKGTGKQAMDQLRADIARLDAALAGEIAVARREAQAARERTRIVSLALQVTLGALLLIAGIITVRTLSGRRRALDHAQNVSARLGAVFDGALDGIITINASGSIESINPAGAAMFGTEPKTLDRRDVGMLFEVAPDRGQLESFLRRLARGAGVNRIQEFAGRRANGETFPCEVAISPVTLSDRTLFVAVVRDISERREVERLKSAFVATVSHELRTPLTSIHGALGLLANGPAKALPAAGQRLVDIALGNSQRLVTLINDILDIEKIESGRMHFDIQPLALASQLARAVAENQPYADQHQVKLVLAAVPDDAMVRADPDRLAQVMANLLSNAAKFSSPGSTVHIEVKPLDRRWRISVIDSGLGIPAEFQPRVFQKFAQADGSDRRQIGGTGLGLSIVKEIVQRFGGQIAFESTPGVGTRFDVDLPWAAPSIPAAPKANLPAILHIEDDPDMQVLVQRALEDIAAVEAVANLAEARRRAANGAFALIILDIGLPDGSGLEMLPADVPVLLFSAEDTAPISGVAAALVKSRANLDDLRATVCRLLKVPV